MHRRSSASEGTFGIKHGAGFARANGVGWEACFALLAASLANPKLILETAFGMGAQ